MTRRRTAAIVGVGFSEVAVHAGKCLGALAIDACNSALADAGLDAADVDGLSSYPSPSRMGAGNQEGIDWVGADYIAQALKLKAIRWSCSITVGAVVASLVHANNAIVSGTCDTVLVWRGMYNPPGKFGAFQGVDAAGDSQFTAPYGLSNEVMRFAMAYSQYMHAYGATREHMATYAVNARKNASINPNAIFFGKPLTREDYLGARMIGEPLSLLDCDRPVDGCGALVVTTAERAADLRQRPVHVLGGATGTGRHSHSPVLDLESTMESAGIVAKALWRNTGLAPGDMDFVNLYDSFSIFVYQWLEAFGFCAPGEACRFIQDGRIALDGALPLNPSGGAIGMGRLHGIPQLLEAVLQLQGRAGQRQLKNARVTLVNAGPPLGSGAAVLGTELA